VSQFKGHSNQINCLAISPDTRIMASGSHDGTLKVWDLANISRPLTTFLQHDAPVMNVKYNPVDKALASGGNDRTVKYWDLDSYSLVIEKNIILLDYKYTSRCYTCIEYPI